MLPARTGLLLLSAIAMSDALVAPTLLASKTRKPSIHWRVSIICRTHARRPQHGGLAQAPTKVLNMKQQSFICEPQTTDEDPEATHLWSKMPLVLRDKYEYTRVLGRGACGIVILARERPKHAKLRNIVGAVAVKLSRTSSGAEPLALREGLVQSCIDSPRVPKCFDYGVSDGIVYLVQEYIEGKTLDKVLEEEGPLKFSEVREIGMQIAAALDDIHGFGFLHRDVKPSNIIRVGEGHGAVYRLIDYGSAVGIGGCLFGGETHEKVSACFLDPNPRKTRDRLRCLYQSLCKSENGKLSADDLDQVLFSFPTPLAAASQRIF